MRRAAALLAVAAAGIAVAAFTAGGDGPERAATAPSPPAPDGLAVWVEQGCGSCHTFAPAHATGSLGPDLVSSLAGMPAAYIRASIVMPGAASAPGFVAGMMPRTTRGGCRRRTWTR